MVSALLLCAGYGSRLRPHTATTPKPLIKVGGRPIIEWWLQKLEDIECKNVIINTHYLSNQIEEYIRKRKTSNMKIEISFEKDLLGTGGTLYKHRRHFVDTTGILIHSDNITEQGLQEVIDVFEGRDPNTVATMLTFNCEKPENCGIVRVGERNILVEYHEKESGNFGNQANGAVFVFDERIFDDFKYVEKNKPIDFCGEIVPKLVRKTNVFHTEKTYIDIGTPSMLEKARSIWG